MTGRSEAEATALAANRANWDERVPIHRRDATTSYGVADFLAGWDKLTAIENAVLGPVDGRAVLHLQCHFGMDGLCLVRRGATLTGLDFSPAAVETARALAADAGLPARFVLAELREAPQAIAERFDIVFASWGVINWAPDIVAWFKVAAEMLRPGGRLALVDAHPGTIAVLEEVDGQLIVRNPWRTEPEAPLRFTAETTYTGDEDRLSNQAIFEWTHPVSAILQAVRDAGLALESFKEHEELAWNAWPMMEPADARLWRLPAGQPRLPLSFSLAARKPG